MADKCVADIVIWSGGYDSTLILDKLCASGNLNVWAYTINWDLVDDLKREQERVVRQNYVEYTKKKGCHFDLREISVSADMSACCSDGLPQAMTWFGVLSQYLPKNSNVYFGYHCGDDFWRFRTEAELGLKSLLAVGNRMATIQYPLEMMSKWQIVKEFRDRRIPNNCVWTCEDPKRKKGKIVACGKCEPCLRLKVAEFEMKLRDK